MHYIGDARKLREGYLQNGTPTREKPAKRRLVKDYP